MKTMCPAGYHHSGFVTTHALGHMMYVENIKISFIFVEKCYNNTVYFFNGNLLPAHTGNQRLSCG